MADRILADLNDDVIAGFERLLDLATGPTEAGGLPIHFTGVEHAVAAAADIDERGFHRGQHVLHDAEVDIADHRRGGRRRDEVLDDDAVLENRDLGVAGALMRRFGANLVPHHHHPVHGLPAGQEFGFGKDGRAAATGIAAVTASLPLGLQSSGTADALDLAGFPVGFRPRRTLVNHGVRRVVGT